MAARDENREEPAIPAAEQLPDDASSMYIVKADIEETNAKAATKRAAGGGTVKPEHLPKDEYVVTRPIESDAGPAEPTEVIEPAMVATEAAPHVVYRDRPVPPKKHGNRGLGVVVALLAAVVFSVFLAFGVLIVFRVSTGIATMDLLANPGYWIPPIFFLVGMLVLVLVLNRAGWWAYIVGSVVVGVFVYFGSAYAVGLVELYAFRSDLTYGAVLASPVTVIAALLAREVALWSGAILGRRGRALAQRNALERAEFDRLQAADAATAGSPAA